MSEPRRGVVFCLKNKFANVSAQEEHKLKLKLSAESAESGEDLVQSSLYKIYFILL